MFVQYHAGSRMARNPALMRWATGALTKVYDHSSGHPNNKAALDTLFSGATYKGAYYGYGLRGWDLPGWTSSTAAPSLAGDINNFAVSWEGEFYAAEGGTWEFYVSSDDAADWFVNSVNVANHYGGHATTEPSTTAPRYGTISLTQGVWYPFLARMEEGIGGADLRIHYRLPSQGGTGGWTIVEASRLRHQP